MLVWGWFVAPLGAPVLGLVQAIGLMCTVRFLTTQMPVKRAPVEHSPDILLTMWTRARHARSQKSRQFWNATLHLFAHPGMVVLIGLVVRAFL